ncbi:MAG: hypothetical protein WC563_15305 [Brevundimonas sp.]
MIIPAVRFNLDEAQAAADEWNFNCGPSSIAAIMSLTPAEVRPLMGDFERKGYTNPTLMFDTLRRMGLKFAVMREADGEKMWPVFGLARIQWGGPWCKPGVPMAARYRHTHWIAVVQEGNLFGRKCDVAIFDINAMCAGGWLRLEEWSTALVPWLLKECCPRSNGEWWITHAVHIVTSLGATVAPVSAEQLAAFVEEQ